MNRQEMEKKIKSLESRNRKLARLKSHYQTESEIISALATVSGVEELANTAVNSIMKAYGGSDVRIYYEMAARWYFCNLSTPPKAIEKIENDEVLKAIYTGEPSNYKSELSTEELTMLINYVHPLVLNERVIGVVVLADIVGYFEKTIADELNNILKFFTLALNNEINSADLIFHAYESLTKKSRELEMEIAEKTREQAKFRNTINSSFDGFWIVSEDLKFIYINDAYCELTGYSGDELIGRSLAFIEAVESEKEIEDHADLLNRKRQDRFETRHRKKDGTVIEVEVNINKSREDGNLYVFIRDITEKKKLEEQHRQVSRMESIGRLAGGIAHDLNNMLTPILAYGDLLSQDLKEEKNRKRAEMILKAGISAREIIQQLLAFSRKQDLTYKIRNLNDIIKNFSILLERTLREDMRFTLDLCENALPVNADGSQIEQVIMNLVVNARDSISGSNGEIRIATSLLKRKEPEEGNLQSITAGPYAKLTVSDNGCGMAPSVLENIFEPFYSTKGEMGTGLGLATVYGIVEQHKGKITVKSDPGKGSEFTIILPIQGEPALPGPDIQNNPDITIANCRILIVEDAEDIRNAVADMLSLSGMEIFIASDVAHAEEILKDHEEINLLLSDIIMPELNGTELYRKLKEKKRDLKVIFMSGYSNEILKEYRIDRKTGSFIRKPFTVEQLLHKIQELFGVVSA